jgi:hypothetical protein
LFNKGSDTIVWSRVGQTDWTRFVWHGIRQNCPILCWTNLSDRLFQHSIGQLCPMPCWTSPLDGFFVAVLLHGWLILVINRGHPSGLPTSTIQRDCLPQWTTFIIQEKLTSLDDQYQPSRARYIATLADQYWVSRER